MTIETFHDAPTVAHCHGSQTWNGLGWVEQYWRVVSDDAGGLWASIVTREPTGDMSYTTPFPVVETTRVLQTWERA